MAAGEEQKNHIPPELRLRIFDNLSTRDLLPVRQTGKLYREYVDDKTPVTAISTSVQWADDFPVRAVGLHELHGLVSFSSLIDLELSNTPLDILKLLPPLPKLKKLSLGHCAFPPRPALCSEEEMNFWKPARAFLAGSSELAHVSFSIPNTEGYKGCDALSTLPKLRKLEITCEFGDPRNVLRSLYRVTGLESFSLSSNRQSSYASIDYRRYTRLPWMYSLRSLKVRWATPGGTEDLTCSARLQAAMLRSCGWRLQQFESWHPPQNLVDNEFIVHDRLPQLQSLRVTCRNMADLLGQRDLPAEWQLAGGRLRSFTTNSRDDFCKLMTLSPTQLTALHLLGSLFLLREDWYSLSQLTGLRDLTVCIIHRRFCPADSITVLSNLTRLGCKIGLTATRVAQQHQMAAAILQLQCLERLDLEIDGTPGASMNSINTLGNILAPAVLNRGLQVHAEFYYIEESYGGNVREALCALSGLESALECISYFQNLEFRSYIFEQLQPFTKLRTLELSGSWQDSQQFADHIGRLGSLTQISYLRVLDDSRVPLDNQALKNACACLVSLRKLCYHPARGPTDPVFRSCCDRRVGPLYSFLMP